MPINYIISTIENSLKKSNQEFYGYIGKILLFSIFHHLSNMAKNLQARVDV